MRKISFLALAAMGLSALASAQNAAPPAANPKPTDIDPAVNTSSPEQTPARETPRPQDVDPAVNPSSPSQTPGAAPSASTPSASSPARSSTSPSPPTSSAARTPATKPAGSSVTGQGAASTATGAATQNPPAAAAAKGKGKALDRLELDTTQITGNRELPKVLYIVPWKRSDLGDLVGKPVNSLLDEVLTPVDRDVFKRENRYYRALTPGQNADQGENATAPASGNATPASTSSGSAAPASRDER
jgi:hypothetical protein